MKIDFKKYTPQELRDAIAEEMLLNDDPKQAAYNALAKLNQRYGIMEKAWFVDLFKGKKDTTKLIKKVITNKKGIIQTVYVAPEEMKNNWFQSFMSFFNFKNENQVNERVKEDYNKNDIKGKFGLTLDSWKNHIGEYFGHKDKWDSLFKKKIAAQNEVKTSVNNIARKQAVAKESFAAKKIQDAAKNGGFNFKAMYFIFNYYKTEAKNVNASRNTENESELRPGTVSADMQEVHSGRTQGSSITNVPERKTSDNRKEHVLSGSSAGERPGRDVRLTAGQIKATRQQILDLLKNKTDEEMTEEDKALLGQYEGAGGLNEENRSTTGVLYEFYTPHKVVDKVWQLVNKYIGSGRKEVLEPSAGIGRFAENQGHNFTMYELDETSARINRILFPDADVVNKPFQEMFMKGGMVKTEYNGKKYDVAIGNPPYGAYSGYHKGLGEGKDHKRYEEYFIDRGLDALEEGGIMAYVVPSSFLRGNQFTDIKSKIAGKGRLLEAYRLPNGTFSTTGVGTDILVIRKEKGNIDDFLDDKYFKKNPGHILGDETTRSGKFGPEQYVSLKDGETFDAALDRINIDAVPVVEAGKPAMSEKAKQNIALGMKGNKNAEGSRGGTNLAVPGKPKPLKEEKAVVDVQGKKDLDSLESFNEKYNKKIHPLELNIWKNTDYSGKIETDKLSKSERAYLDTSENICLHNGDYIHVTNYASGNIYNKLQDLENQKESMSPEKYLRQKALLDAARPEFKTTKNFTISPISDFAKNFRFDDDSIVDKDGNKGNPLIRRFMQWATGREHSFYNMDWQGGVTRHDIPSGISWSDIIDYISQNSVRADTRGDKETNQIQAAQKRELRRDVTEKLFKRFIENGLTPTEQAQLEMTYNYQFNSYKAPDYSAIPLFIDGISKSFKGQELVVKEKQMQGASFLCNKGNGLLAYDVGVGKTMTGIIATVNQLQTGRAKRPVVCVPKAVYENWLKEIKDMFPNVKVNELGNLGSAYVSPNLKIEDGTLSVMTYEALQKITFKPETVNGELISDMLDSQQIDSEGMSDRERELQKEKIYEKLGIASKTDAAVYNGMTLKNLKISSKDGIKKYNGDEIAASAIKSAFTIFGENFLVVKGDKYWEVVEYKSGRRICYASTKEAAINEATDVFSSKGEDVIKKGIENSGIVNSSQENHFETMPEKTGNEESNTDDGEDVVVGVSHYLEDLGFDHITVDEVHNFKNVFGQAKPEKSASGKQVANEFQGLMGGESARAMKMFAMSQVIQSKNNDRNIFALSATPFTNSPLEIYNILSLVARKRLKELKIYNLHEFMAQFAKLKSEWAVKTDGKVERKSVMKEFQNLSALQNLIREYIDKIDGDEAGIIRPNKNTHLVEMNMTPTQKAIYAVEVKRFDAKGPDGKPVPGAALKAINNMRMASLSPSLITFDEMYNGTDIPETVKAEDLVEDSPKLKFTFDSVANFWHERKDLGQVVYMPRGVGDFNEAVNNLVKKGIPKTAIATISSKTSNKAKENIMADFNNPDGRIKVIIGSETIKEGINLNGNSVVLYNTLLGWNPSETVQVEGRVWRQGNKQGQVHIVYPQLLDSVDAAMYQKHDEKKQRFDAIWSFKGDALNVEDINPEELKFELIKDPEKRAKFMMDLKLEDIENQKRDKRIFIDILTKFKADYVSNERIIKNKTEDIPRYESDVKEAEEEVIKQEEALKEYKAKTSKKEPSYERKIDDFERELRWARDKFNGEKKALRDLMKEIKFAQDENEGISSKLNNMAIEHSKIDERIAVENKTLEDLHKEETDIKNNKEKYVAQAKADIAASKKEVPPLHETIKNHVNLMLGNIKPMEEVLKEMGKAVKIRFYRRYNPETAEFIYERI